MMHVCGGSMKMLYSIGETGGSSGDNQRQAADAPVYDLQGRKLNSKPEKGLYIYQGRKYMK